MQRKSSIHQPTPPHTAAAAVRRRASRVARARAVIRGDKHLRAGVGSAPGLRRAVTAARRER